MREGIEAIMIRTVSPQPTLWESVIPQCLMGLPGDLAEIDASSTTSGSSSRSGRSSTPVIGRPSIPMETYIRMMFLKYRYKIGFEPLCREVADSLAWRRFCRIPWSRRCPIPPR